MLLFSDKSLRRLFLPREKCGIVWHCNQKGLFIWVHQICLILSYFNLVNFVYPLVQFSLWISYLKVKSSYFTFI